MKTPLDKKITRQHKKKLERTCQILFAHGPPFQCPIKHRHWLPGVHCHKFEGELYQNGLNHVWEDIRGSGIRKEWSFFWRKPRITWRFYKSFKKEPSSNFCKEGSDRYQITRDDFGSKVELKKEKNHEKD